MRGLPSDVEPYFLYLLISSLPEKILFVPTVMRENTHTVRAKAKNNIKSLTKEGKGPLFFSSSHLLLFLWAHTAKSSHISLLVYSFLSFYCCFLSPSLPLSALQTVWKAVLFSPSLPFSITLLYSVHSAGNEHYALIALASPGAVLLVTLLLHVRWFSPDVTATTAAAATAFPVRLWVILPSWPAS